MSTEKLKNASIVGQQHSTLSVHHLHQKQLLENKPKAMDTVNNLFISFIIFLAFDIALFFTFIIIGFQEILLARFAVQLIWFSLLAAAIYLLALVLVPPMKLGGFIGLFIWMVLAFLGSWCLGVTLTLLLTFTLAWSYAALTILWVIALIATLGRILTSNSLTSSVGAVVLYSLLVIGYFVLVVIILGAQSPGIITILTFVGVLLYFFMLMAAAIVLSLSSFV